MHDEINPYEYTPPCTCIRLDVDLVDDRDCERCNPDSGWNRDCAAFDRGEKIEPPPAAEPNEAA